MESVRTRFSTLSVNHVLFVCLCAVVVYLFRAGDTYYLKPVWRKRVESHQFANGEYPTEKDQLPPPIVTDLESDGVNEVVLITNDMKLTILALPDSDPQNEAILPHVIVKHKVTLPLVDARPVIMKTGFTVPLQSMVQMRSQMIIIVSSKWQVLCYSPDLTLLWQRQLLTNVTELDEYDIRAMAVLVTSHSVKKNDGGLVIVGGSLEHRKHREKAEEEAHFRNHTSSTYTTGHFSTFALSGNNGSVRWSHQPGDFGEQLVDDVKVRQVNSSRKGVASDFHWKLALRKNRLHKGEVPWRHYRDNVHALLPYQWSNMEDTRFLLSRFQRDSQTLDTGESEEEEESTKSSALKPEHIVGYAYGGQRPHGDEEHVENPNVVIIHRENGLEVLSLLSGRPVTRVEFIPDASIYVDIDGDEEPERITWGQEKDHTVCYIDMWRQQPIREKLEQLSVCITKRLVWTRTWALEEDFYKKLPPFIINSVVKRKGIIPHLMGHHLASDSKYDLISVTSLGRVSSFDLEGNIHWQAQTEAAWAHIASTVRRDRARDKSQTKEFFDSFRPGREMLSVKVYDRKNALVLAGYSNLALVDIIEGQVLGDHSIPAPPTAPLVVGDFNNDGLNDVILTCKMGYIGFILQSQTNHKYTVMYAAAVFLSIFLFTLCLSPDVWSKSEEDEE